MEVGWEVVLGVGHGGNISGSLEVGSGAGAEGGSATLGDVQSMARVGLPHGIRAS